MSCGGARRRSAAQSQCIMGFNRQEQKLENVPRSDTRKSTHGFLQSSFTIIRI
jgi:hypothetical protein